MTTAKGVTTKRKLFGNKLATYLAANPSEYDVTFLVGPEKKKIRSLRIALKAASPAFDKLFKEKWDTILGRGESGFPLPDLEPTAFQTFIELLLSDDSVEQNKRMKFGAETILNLLKMSHDFEVQKLQKVFQPLADKIFMDFETFSKSDDFFNLSRETLEIILASDLLKVEEIQIFNAACKWAEKQCAKQGLEPTGHNLRGSLGSAIFKIRFPLMTNTEFGNIVCSKDILTTEEQLQLFLYISTGSPQNSRDNLFPFNTHQRKNCFDLMQRVPVSQAKIPAPIVASKKQDSILNLVKDVNILNDPPFVCDGNETPLFEFNVSLKNKLDLKEKVPVAQTKKPASIVVAKQQDGTVNFFKDVKIVNDPPFVCDGRKKTFFHFNVSSRIALKSVGFLGPVNGDATYNVTIDVKRHPRKSSLQLICSIQKKVEAKEGQIFHVTFDDPPVIEAYATKKKNEFSTSNGVYCVFVTILGPDTLSAQFLNGSWYKDSRSEVDGVTIYTQQFCDQLAEIKFRKC